MGNITDIDYLSDPMTFHLVMPLYFEIDLTNINIQKRIYTLLNYYGTIDSYCVDCQKESVFDSNDRYTDTFLVFVKYTDRYFQISYTCTRDHKHEYTIFYRKLGNKFYKVGQYPSVADFQIPGSEKYRKILGDDKYKEFTKGLGLFAHGVGIGSFVYLRRIFESLVEEAHILAQKQRFSETKYKKSRMDEKIQMLSKYLPEFLVENKKIYSILSKGIHQLEENECLKYFNSVRIGIEQILDEKIEKQEKLRKADEARHSIQGVVQEISSKDK